MCSYRAIAAAYPEDTLSLRMIGKIEEMPADALVTR